MTIEEFIEARLRDDETAAHRALEGPARLEPGWEVATYEVDLDDRRCQTVADSSGVFLASELGRLSDHIARHDPARVLRQCAALRAVVRHIETVISPSQQIEAEADVLYPIAAVWSDHDEYHKEWAL